MTFELPLPPNRAQDSRGWRGRYFGKKAYFERLDELQLIKQVPGPPPQPFAHSIISARLYVWNLMDEDALTGRCKWPIDWLVTRGYLVDDTPENLIWEGLPTQKIDRKRRRLEIRLRPLSTSETPAG